MPGGGGAADAGGVLPPPPEDEHYVYPEEIYTGFDGQGTFRVPVSTDLAGASLVWSIDDPTIASIAPAAAPADLAEYGESWALITVKKAGTTVVRATLGTSVVSSPLNVKSYTTAQVMIGSQRYNSPADANAPQRTACASCHASANGVDHSPLALAAYDDDDILSAITTGVYAVDGYVLQGVNHKWNLTAEEKTGILPYLRSLPPRGFSP